MNKAVQVVHIHPKHQQIAMHVQLVIAAQEEI